MTEKENELKKKQIALRKVYTLNIPLSILFVLAFSFVDPYLPRKGGKPPMIEVMDYSTAVIQSGVLLFIILLISYYWIISKKKKEIEKIEREIHIEKKGVKKYNSISNFRQ
ncbi:hypothetical protein [Tenacibaculum sp.]|uniref:hypothetical protein n=1 Tax=Tenacibaculum sp. TaxID=1906242 RepID=UPI003D0A1F61